jgi:hypothetical protein
VVSRWSKSGFCANRIVFNCVSAVCCFDLERKRAPPPLHPAIDLCNLGRTGLLGHPRAFQSSGLALLRGFGLEYHRPLIRHGSNDSRSRPSASRPCGTCSRRSAAHDVRLPHINRINPRIDARPATSGGSAANSTPQWLECGFVWAGKSFVAIRYVWIDGLVAAARIWPVRRTGCRRQRLRSLGRRRDGQPLVGQKPDAASEGGVWCSFRIPGRQLRVGLDIDVALTATAVRETYAPHASAPAADLGIWMRGQAPAASCARHRRGLQSCGAIPQP